jgi:hypothetical protein
MMWHVETPWIGLIALLAMFVLPFVPSWVFEGPRTVKHRPRRHVCADCDAPWADGHVCVAAGRVPGRELPYVELRRPTRRVP